MIFLNEGGPLHDTLNPKLWDKDNNLLPEVKEKLNEIVESFKEYLNNYKKDFSFNIIDVNLVGSNASYNYTEHSDLDVSVIIPFELVNSNYTISNDYFHCKKNEFNETYKPTIRGIEVELYVEDVKASPISNGVYSLTREKWIKFPEKIEVPEGIDVTDNVEEVSKAIDNTVEKGDLDSLNKLMSAIYLMRRNSLIVKGEYGVGNLTYKELRNQGALDKLHDAIIKAKSDQLSIKEADKEAEGEDLFYDDEENE